MQIQASATDSDGAINQVTFYVDGTPLPGCTNLGSAPYSCTWSPTVGDYALTARATDDDAVTATSAAINVHIFAPNVPPTISLDQPLDGATFDEDSTLTLQATAFDSDGAITQVVFYADGEAISGCSFANPPYQCLWTPPAGAYLLTAIATDDDDSMTTSAAVSIGVSAPTNQAPTVTILLPADGTSVLVGSEITIQAGASDPDGAITQVAFFADGQPIAGCVDSTAPYQCNWAAEAGTHTLTATATDDGNSVTRSDPITLIVNTPTNQPPHYFHRATSG